MSTRMVGMALRRVTTQQSNLRPNFLYTNKHYHHLKASNFLVGCRNFFLHPLRLLLLKSQPSLIGSGRWPAQRLLKRWMQCSVWRRGGASGTDFQRPGDIGEGLPPTNLRHSCCKQTNFSKMFNRELKPATAFMYWSAKLSGDLSKAWCSRVMKASRDEP